MTTVPFLFIILLIVVTVSSSHQYCYEFAPPEHGSIEFRGMYYKVSCDAGYRLQGNSYVICGPDGSWEEQRPKCIKQTSYSQTTAGKNRFHERNKPLSLHHLPNSHNPSNELGNNRSCNDLQCEQLCLIEETGPHCRCCAGYKLNPRDNRTCNVYKPERINRKDCSRICKNMKDVATDLCSCPQGYKLDSERKDCIDIDECNINNFGCSDSCINVEGSAYCDCPDGFKLDANGKNCIEETSQPEFSCSVYNGGCHHECKMIDSRTIECVCRKGYQLHSDRKHCFDVNECLTDNFGCSHFCINTLGSAYCICPKGFQLDQNGKKCIDIDECRDKNLNRCHHYCNNIEGSFTCSCQPGYILINGNECKGCRKNSHWSYERNGCVDCPKNSHTDSEGKMSIRDCKCNSGYSGNPGEYISCEDIDECSSNNFGCSDECINIPGSAYCTCPQGFKLDSDNKTCVDIDECSIKNGGCEGSCINYEGSFQCICPEGFVSSDKDRYSCDDIDECSLNNGGCDQLCINYHGGFYCACKPGYLLDSTLKNCTDVQCPKLPLPHYSSMKCMLKNKALLEENSYPFRTECTFTCFRGYKNIKHSNTMKCTKNGTWSGTLPECISQACPPLQPPQNGEVYPRRCTKHGAAVKQKCTFSCHAGYILVGDPVFQCKNNLTWNKKNLPVCEHVKIYPTIKCPHDIRVVLSQGQATHNISVPEPTTNLGYYEVHPSWITINDPVEFPVGVTDVTFTAISPFNETAQCVMTVTVLDEEPPVFNFCPDPIIIEGVSGDGVFVTWIEPFATDNVELVSVFSLMKPNTTLTPGTYFVEYVAKDSSGNIGTCSFDISIMRVNCSDMKDPAHGSANCMDWMFGKLCSPECDDGYMRDPEEPMHYSCDDTGVWEPTDHISECLPFIPATSSICQDGFVFKSVNTTGEEVCIQCSSSSVWSATTRRCEKSVI